MFLIDIFLRVLSRLVLAEQWQGKLPSYPPLILDQQL